MSALLAPLSLGELELVWPLALLLLLALPAWWLWRRRRRPPAIVFSRVAPLARGPHAGRGIARALVVLRNLAIAGLVVALARPRSHGRAEQVNSEGINIVVAFDISSSMLAEDFQPQNRLEVAKDVVKRFVAARQSDRIGVVAFSGEALTQVPLTTDYPVVQAAVDNLAPGQLEDGTAIGTAIATAANRLRTAPGRSRVVVLLTDGENNRGAIDPRTAAQAAATFGIKIYTIGVGTEGMAPVPVGRGLFGLRYENRPVRIDEALLTDVARVTNGRYYRARDAAALERIAEEIDRLERTPVRTTSYVRYSEQFRWPLGVALFALTLELALLAWRGPLP
jgi:Ca-activated chloride channel homolog